MATILHALVHMAITDWRATIHELELDELRSAWRPLRNICPVAQALPSPALSVRCANMAPPRGKTRSSPMKIAFVSLAVRLI